MVSGAQKGMVVIMAENKDILLSVSMLVSGREEMEKSLDSLHFFREAFPCEVILVDTGCNAHYRAIAERYADKIVDFTWCDDFAAARNAGLKEAQGEWFMFLDDDEWFENPQEIVAFFTTGEYKEYNSASYVVRNYSDPQGQLYEDCYPSRMVKREPETIFFGRIHEVLQPFKMPMKLFADFAHHYGYAYKSDEERMAHNRRNLPLIEAMCKENPGDPRWSCQLTQEYFAAKDYEKTVESGIHALEEWRAVKDKISYGLSHVGALYAYILIGLEMQEKYEEVWEWLDKAIAEPIFEYKFMEPTVAFYCMVGARVSAKTGRNEKACFYLRKYLESADKLQGNRAMIEAGGAAIVAGVYQEQLLYGTLLLSTHCAAAMEDYELAEKAFYRMKWQEDKRLLRQSDFEKELLQTFCGVAYHPLWGKMLHTLVAREEGIKEMLVVFLEVEVDLGKKNDLEKLQRFRRLAAETDYEHPYFLSMRVLWAADPENTNSAEAKRKEAEEAFECLFEKFPEKIPEVRGGVWDAGEKLGISCADRLLQIDYNQWKRILKNWLSEASLQEIRLFESRVSGWLPKEDDRLRLLRVKYLEVCLRDEKETFDAGLFKTESLLWRYADNVLKLYLPVYQEAAVRESPWLLQEEVQLALALKKLQDSRERGDVRESLAILRESISLYPALEVVMNEYAKRYRDEVSNQETLADKEKQELEELVVNLKMMARIRIDKGEQEEAKEILLQIKQCMPGDRDVEEMLGQIGKEQV